MTEQRSLDGGGAADEAGRGGGGGMESSMTRLLSVLDAI